MCMQQESDFLTASVTYRKQKASGCMLVVTNHPNKAIEKKIQKQIRVCTQQKQSQTKMHFSVLTSVL